MPRLLIAPSDPSRRDRPRRRLPRLPRCGPVLPGRLRNRTSFPPLGKPRGWPTLGSLRRVPRRCLPTSLEPIADRSLFPATAAGCAARRSGRYRPQPRPGSRPECSTSRPRCPTPPRRRLARSDLRSWSRRPPLRPLPNRRGLPTPGASRLGFRPAASPEYRRRPSSLRHRRRVRSARSRTATNPGPPVRWPRPAEARLERAEWRQDREVRRIATGEADSVGRTIRKWPPLRPFCRRTPVGPHCSAARCRSRRPAGRRLPDGPRAGHAPHPRHRAVPAPARRPAPRPNRQNPASGCSPVGPLGAAGWPRCAECRLVTCPRSCPAPDAAPRRLRETRIGPARIAQRVRSRRPSATLPRMRCYWPCQPPATGRIGTPGRRASSPTGVPPAVSLRPVRGVSSPEPAKTQPVLCRSADPSSDRARSSQRPAITRPIWPASRHRPRWRMFRQKRSWQSTAIAKRISWDLLPKQILGGTVRVSWWVPSADRNRIDIEVVMAVESRSAPATQFGFGRRPRQDRYQGSR